MIRFSANLGFLWSELPLPDAIREAANAGFDAVECHWPFDTSASEVRAALDETGLPMLGLNTRQGEEGENGLLALPGREDDAKASIREALDYAAAIGAGYVHALAGFAYGERAEATFIRNLGRACEMAGERTILIEPLNPRDAPGYFLRNTDQASEILRKVDAPNLKLLFDCYHVQIVEGDLSRRIERLLPDIGHVQFASVPDRGPPDHGEINYRHIFALFDRLGYDRPLGAEYRPEGSVRESLGWLPRRRV